ncbi:MAG: protein kinase [Phycisphaerae bacterium]|nr:protein kinase [Phycisphaerae bacterium]
MYQPKSGDRISEYLLLEQVGAGSFGEVWKARHHVWQDQIVAVKLATDAQYVRNLQREGVTIHGLRHPNIVRALGLDPYAAPPYLVMEFIDGPSLRQVVDTHPEGIPLASAMAVLRGMLEALAVAHENGIIHRDVKPANVLIASREGVEAWTPEVVRITDFGLGQAAGLTTTSIMASGSLLTDEGKSISGTIAYMAPEQRDGLDLDARADLYSCGVVLFELVTGKRPQGGDLPSHLRSELPKWLDEFFARCYTRREHRFSSAREMLDELARHARVTELPRATPVARLPKAIPPAAKGRTRREFCEKCGTRLAPEDNFCIKCGQQVNPNPPRCTKCGAYIDAGDKYCILCGASLVSRGC